MALAALTRHRCNVGMPHEIHQPTDLCNGRINLENLNEATARRFDVGTAILRCWLRQLEPQAKRVFSCPKLPKAVVLAEVELYPDLYHFVLVK